MRDLNFAALLIYPHRPVRAPTLEFDNHIATQLQVVEQQVNEEFISPYIQQHLAADKGEARAQFQQKIR